MPIIIVSDGQTLLDIAVQHCGDATMAFKIAKENGLSFSDDLITGNSVVVADVAVDKRKLVDDFSKQLIVPASKKEDAVLLSEGIGYWAVGTELIVQ